MFFKKSKKQQNITVTSKKNIANISKRNITDIYKKGKLQIFLRMPQNITNITERTAEYYKYFQKYTETNLIIVLKRPSHPVSSDLSKTF